MESPGLPAARSHSRTRIILALLLCAVSIAAIAVAAFGTTSSGGDRWVILYLAAAAWVLAAVVLAPTLTSANSITLVAVATYAVAFLLPAISRGDDSYQGVAAFVVGWAVVPLAWVANPLFLVSLALWQRGGTAAAGVVGAIACVLALTVLVMPNWNGWGPAAGFWLWAAAPGFVAFASVIVPRPAGHSVDQARLLPT